MFHQEPVEARAEKVSRIENNLNVIIIHCWKREMSILPDKVIFSADCLVARPGPYEPKICWNGKILKTSELTPSWGTAEVLDMVWDRSISLYQCFNKSCFCDTWKMDCGSTPKPLQLPLLVLNHISFGRSFHQTGSRLLALRVRQHGRFYQQFLAMGFGHRE